MASCRDCPCSLHWAAGDHFPFCVDLFSEAFAVSRLPSLIRRFVASRDFPSFLPRRRGVGTTVGPAPRRPCFPVCFSLGSSRTDVGAGATTVRPGQARPASSCHRMLRAVSQSDTPEKCRRGRRHHSGAGVSPAYIPVRLIPPAPARAAAPHEQRHVPPAPPWQGGGFGVPSCEFRGVPAAHPVRSNAPVTPCLHRVRAAGSVTRDARHLLPRRSSRGAATCGMSSPCRSRT